MISYIVGFILFIIFFLFCCIRINKGSGDNDK